MTRKLNIAIVGMGFGAEFIPIYQRHPHTNMYAICQRTRSKLDAIGDAFGVAKRYDDFNALLRDPNVDAVHINSPIPDHAWMSLAALAIVVIISCVNEDLNVGFLSIAFGIIVGGKVQFFLILAQTKRLYSSIFDALADDDAAPIRPLADP